MPEDAAKLTSGYNVRQASYQRLHINHSLTLSALCRPISKQKAFRMTRIIQAAKIYNAEESLATAASERALNAEHAAQGQQQQKSVSRGFAAGVEGWT